MRVHGTKLGAISTGRGLGDQLYDLAGQVPPLDLNFAGTKTLDPRVTHTRAGSAANAATFVDSSGVLQRAVTNLLLRSEEFGTTWSPNNISITSDAAIAPNGNLTADKAIATSTNATHQLYQVTSGTSGVTYTFSFYVKAGEFNRFSFGPGNSAVGGLDRIATINLGLANPIVSQDAFLNNSTFVTPVGNGWHRVGCTFTATATGTMTIATLQVLFNNSGAASYAGDGTSGIFLWGAQLEQASTVGDYVPTTSAINSAPRFDHNITSSRTNHIRNNTMVGAVAGTPGTNPTNWVVSSTTAGITRQIVGTGTENGIDYIDYRVAGTTTSALFFSIAPETSSSVAAINGQTWTFSSYARLVAGSLAGFTQLNFYIAFNNSSGTAVQFFTGGITPTSAALSTQRFTRVATASNATTAFVQPALQFEAPTGTSIDVTIRIGLPQLEQGSVATSVIPTSTAAVTDNTTDSLGLLVEEARTNLMAYSEQLNDSVWGPVVGTVTPNAETSPANTLTADKLIAANGGPQGQLAQGATITSGATVTASVYAKAGGFDRLELVLLAANNTTPYGRSTFNPNTGVITTAASTSNGGTNASSAVQALSNGWYRFSVTVTYPAVTSAGMRLVVTNSDAANGDGVKGVFLWGAQLEVGAFPTSYVPTTTATVTRAADVASITGANFSSWYNQTEGTVFMGYLPIGLRTSYPLSIDDGTTNNFIGFGFDSGANRFGRIDTGGVTQASITQGLVSVGSESKGAMALATNNVAASFNGAVPTADTSVTIPTVDRVRLHALGGSTTFAFNGHIRRLCYWPTRLSNTTLQQITQP